jgi:hypothetical protein
MRLMTLEVDAAGKGVVAVARDRDAEEAEQLLVDLAEACRRARVPVRPHAFQP